MILVLALALWLIALLVVTAWPRLDPTTRREAQVDLGLFGVLGAATVGFFWRLLITQDVWMPAGGGDLAGFLYPTYQFAALWWRSGVIPLWNPYLFGGQPFVGDIQSGIFYPLNLITDFISNPLTFRDLELLSVLHFYIAGAGMYALLRWGRFTTSGTGPVSGLARWACLAGAVAFEFSDLFITHFGNLNLIASAAWLPLIFLFFSRALDTPPLGSDTAPRRLALTRNGLPFAALAGVLLAVSFLAGHVQSFVAILLAIGLYAVYRALMDRRQAISIFASLGVTLVIGLGLAALVLLPSIEMARASVRSSFSYENAAQFSLPPTQLVGLVVPGFFGRDPQAAWGPWARVEVGYLGILPLILAVLALVLKREHDTWFFGLLALFGLGLALGGYAILHGWLYAFAPGLNQLRVPARFIYLLDFGLAVLAALGLDRLLHPLSDSQQQTLRAILRVAPWIFLIIAVGLGALALSTLILGQGQDPVLYQRMGSAANASFFFILLLALSLLLLFLRDRNVVRLPVWAGLVLALILFDLFSLGANVDIGLNDPTANYNRDDIVAFLQTDPSYYRVDSRGTGVQGAWLPDTAILYWLYDVNGDNPLTLSEFDRYWSSVGSRDSAMYQRLNVKYVLARRSTPLPANFKHVFDGASGVSVWENSASLPRARIVYNSQVVNSPAEALDVVGREPTDQIVLLQEQPRQGAGAVADDTATITRYSPNEIDLQVSGGGERYLVLSEVYYPGWRAFVDGQETDVLRADYLFRAIALTPGAHQVRLVYDPLSFKLGAVISLVTLLGLIVGALWIWRQPRRSFTPH